MSNDIADEIFFGPFHLDCRNARLEKERVAVALTPKSFDVLALLASQPNQLVTKKQLLDAVWPDVIVSDASIKVCILEIRKALGDESKSPSYIQTVHRRGYRFIAKTRTGGVQAPSAEPPLPDALQPLVARDRELDQLAAAFSSATKGQRQCVFIGGGAGTGKTALVERFVANTRATASPLLVMIGRCFQQFGTSEPYMPVFEALAAAASRHDSEPLRQLLGRHEEALAVNHSTAGVPDARATARPLASSQRMLRDIADAIDALAVEAPLVLVLEDIHWSDCSTLDLISALARRTSPSRILVIATYRPDDTPSDHPLRQVIDALNSARLSRAIDLECLDVAGVEAYLTQRFAGNDFPASLARKLKQRTGGHPLHLVQLVDDLIDQGVLQQQAGQWTVSGAREPTHQPAWMAILDTQVPQSVRSMIAAQFQRLGDDQQRVLEAASVAGVEFSAAAVAAALERDLVPVEQTCEELARHHRFLKSLGIDEWPDGTTATRYRFLHDLYHDVVYERMPAASRAVLHQRVGLRLEQAFGDRAPEEAATLAMHFETARDWERALVHLLRAGDSASRHYAHREAVHYLRRAQAALDKLPPGDRRAQELQLLVSMGVNLQVTQGWAAPEVEKIYARATGMCEQSGQSPDDPATFPIYWGIWVFHKVRSDLVRAEALAKRLLEMAESSGDTALLMQALQSMTITALCLGNPESACRYARQAEQLYEPRHAGNTARFGQDPGVACLSFGSVALAIFGESEQEQQMSAKSLQLAREIRQPTSLAMALHFAAMLHQLRGDAARCGEFASEAIALAGEEGFSFWHAGAQVLLGWAQSVAECSTTAIERIQSGIDSWSATGSRTYEPYYLGLLADAQLRQGEHAQALRTVDSALDVVNKIGERLYEAALWQLKARALCNKSGREAADARQKGALIARTQRAKLFEADPNEVTGKHRSGG